jgi:hypothetical protein
VYVQFVKNFPALIGTLEENHLNLRDGTAREKEKSKDCGQLRNKIMNSKFALLMLCGVCDIYNLFSKIVNILQKVNMLPHVKYDVFVELCGQFKDMCKSMDCHETKCNKDKCFWPYLHGNLTNITELSSFRGIPLVSPSSERACLKRSLDHYSIQEQQTPLTSDKDQIFKKLNVLAKRVGTDLIDSVYDSKAKTTLTNLRILCDIKGLKTNIDRRGTTLTYSLTVGKFMKAARIISTIIDEIPESQLLEQYKMYLQKLAGLENKLQSLDYLKLLLSTKSRHFEGCQAILHVICTGATFFGVESILESYVSMHEHRINLNRAGKINEERHSQELNIYINGPPVHLSRSIIKEAMNRYWHDKTFANRTKEWHFTRTTSDVKNYLVSKVVDRHRRESCSLPFMINDDVFINL